MYVFRPFIYKTIYIHQGWLAFYFRESFRMEKLLYPLHKHRSKQITPKQNLHARQSLKVPEGDLISVGFQQTDEYDAQSHTAVMDKFKKFHRFIP